MEIEFKKEIVNKRKKDVPPHVLEMGLNMLFVEPNDVLEYLKTKDGFVPLVDINDVEDKRFDSVLVDLSDMAYDESLDKIGFAKQYNTSMVVLFKDIILDEYQIYMHRIYGADAIIFPVYPITSKTLSKFIFVCNSMGVLPIPLIEDKADLNKIEDWDLVKVAAIKIDCDVPKGVLIAKYNEGSGLEICLTK